MMLGVSSLLLLAAQAASGLDCDDATITLYTTVTAVRSHLGNNMSGTLGMLSMFDGTSSIVTITGDLTNPWISSMTSEWISSFNAVSDGVNTTTTAIDVHCASGTSCGLNDTTAVIKSTHTSTEVQTLTKTATQTSDGIVSKMAPVLTAQVSDIQVTTAALNSSGLLMSTTTTIASTHPQAEPALSAVIPFSGAPSSVTLTSVVTSTSVVTAVPILTAGAFPGNLSTVALVSTQNSSVLQPTLTMTVLNFGRANGSASGGYATTGGMLITETSDFWDLPSLTTSAFSSSADVDLTTTTTTTSAVSNAAVRRAVPNFFHEPVEVVTQSVSFTVKVMALFIPAFILAVIVFG